MFIQIYTFYNGSVNPSFNYGYYLSLVPSHSGQTKKRKGSQMSFSENPLRNLDPSCAEFLHEPFLRITLKLCTNQTIILTTILTASLRISSA